MSDEADPSAAGAPFRASVARTPADVLVLVERIRMHAAEVQTATRPERSWITVSVVVASAAAVALPMIFRAFSSQGDPGDLMFRVSEKLSLWLLIPAFAAASSLGCLGAFAIVILISRRLFASTHSYLLSHARLEQALQMAAGALGSDPALRREHPHAWLLLTEAVELGNDILQRAPRPRRSPSEPAASPPSPGDPTPTPPLLNKHLVNGEFH